MFLQNVGSFVQITWQQNPKQDQDKKKIKFYVLEYYVSNDIDLLGLEPAL
jgi:hypothetical protein